MTSRAALVVLTVLFLTPSALAADEPPEYVEGNRLIAKGEYEAALAHFEELHRANPEDPLPLQRLAYTHIRMGSYEEAEQQARRSLDVLGEAHSVSYFLIGKALEGQDRRDAAREAFQRGAEAGYRTGDREGILGTLFSHFNAGLHAALAGENAEALAHFDEVLKLDKKNAYAHYEMAIIAQGEGKREEAAGLYAMSLADKLEWLPQEMWVYPVQRYVFFAENAKTRLSPLLIEQGKAGEAEAMLRPVHESVVRRVKSKPVEMKKDPLGGELDSAFEDAGYWLGTALIELGRKKEARDMFKAWSRLRVGTPTLRDEAKRRVKELK